MRLRKLHARVFGVLRERTFETPPEAALVFGANESGKSTFRSALETILYGFEPANREEHPLAAWEGGVDLALAAEIEREQGSPLRVERELRTRGRSRTAEGDAPFGAWSSNAPLACVGDLPRALFREVYSLELAQLAALGEGVQDRVDELLLPQAPGLSLRPVGELREELRKAHQALWRPDRRASTRASELLGEITGQRGALNAAAIRERELRSVRTEAALLAERIPALEARRRDLDRTHHDAPFLGQLHGLARRQSALGPPIDLSTLGDFAWADPSEIAREIEGVEARLREPVARLARAPESLDEREQALLAAAPEIERARQAAGAHGAERERHADRVRHALVLREGAAQELAAVLGRTATPAELEAARLLPLAALRALHADWSAARSAPFAGQLGATPFRMLVAAAASFAIAALLAGFSAPLSEWLAQAAPTLARLARPLALLAGGLGLAALAAAFFLTRRPSPPPAQLGTLLASLVPAAGLCESPDGLLRLIDQVKRAQEKLAELRVAEADAGSLASALDARQEQLARLCSALTGAADGDVETSVERLGEALRRSRERERQVDADRQQRLRAQDAIAALRPGLELAQRRRERVEALLRECEPTAPAGEAFARVEARRREAQALRELEAELRRDPRFAALAQDPRAAAARDPLESEWHPEAVAQRERERAECERELSAALTRRGEITNLLREDEGGRQARAEDRVRAAEEALADTKRERDRLALLEAIVARAEQVFRERHQPDVLRRASVYLERVTHGRYRRVDLRAERELVVSGDDPGDARIVGEPLSRGTLDQIFLCLRLGLLDHLDEGRERLPLVLDDALLRMDDERRAAVYELLGEISRARQVFLLTCQEWIAAEAERAWKLRRIPLSG